MIALRLALAAAVLAGCGMLEPVPVDPRYALVIVNDSDDHVFWWVEQPTGEMTRFEVAPCGSLSDPIDIDRAWEVEWGATFAVTAADVQPLEAPFTVVEVRFGPNGALDVARPRAANAPPDAPLDLACVRQ
jgi:hypothetical protein